MVKRLIAIALLAGCILVVGCVPMDAVIADQRAAAQATLDAANRYSTRTAQDAINASNATQQVIAATATAQASELERERIRATQTVQAVYLSATQRAWELESTAQAAQVWAYQTQQANAAALDRLKLERQTIINKTQAVAPWVIGLILCAVLFYASTVLAIAQSRRPQVIKRDERGYAPILRDPQTNAYYDADRNPGPLLTADPKTGANVPISADPAQLDVTRRAQAIHLVHDGAPDRPTPAIPRSVTESPAPAVSVETPAAPALPASADWTRMLAWPGRQLCLGAGEGDAPVLIDPEDRPHLLFAGTSGSGKSRGGLRPLAAELLADGKQIVIVDRSGLDFLPYTRHPNARVLTLHDRPEQAVTYLRRAYGEILRRFEVLRSAGVSTWSRLPTPDAPETWIVMDEFSNLADSMSAGDREELWRQARMIAAEGRKAGLHLAIALQDPTHRSLDLRIRRNMTNVCFAVKDQDASRVVLGMSGAEKLPAGQFITVLGVPVTGVAFNPSDGDLIRFLDARASVPALPAPDWLDVDIHSMPDQAEEHERIRAMHAAGKSLAEIQRSIFGYTGGRAYEAVRAVLLGDDPKIAPDGAAA